MPTLAELGEVYAQPPDQRGLLAKLGDTWPARLAQSIWGGMTLPGDVYAGRVPVTGDDGRTNPQVIGRSADLASMIMGGTYGTASPITSEAVLGAGPIKRLPYSNSLATPPSPTLEDMARAARIEKVSLDQARGTQPKMEWERFEAGKHPPPLLPQYADRPVAVRREDGEYLIFDGHHRTAKAMNDGLPAMEMYVIDAKDYAPEFAGRKSQPSKLRWTDADEEILRELMGKDGGG